ncbi:ORF6N domain-containing protein [Candidatus Margulisiibacteriota bacterium]
MSNKPSNPNAKPVIPAEAIVNKIFLIRNMKVMLDRDLADLYGVETRTLNQAVRRNLERFPDDFMFQLTKEETENWKSQIVISNSEKMGLRKQPLAFTEQGVAMLSSVLNSRRAIEINIQIMRAFTKMRELFATHKDLQRQVEDMIRVHGKKLKDLDYHVKAIYEVIQSLLETPASEVKQIGFRPKQ